jgi:hypothetical protein
MFSWRKVALRKPHRHHREPFKLGNHEPKVDRKSIAIREQCIVGERIDTPEFRKDSFALVALTVPESVALLLAPPHSASSERRQHPTLLQRFLDDRPSGMKRPSLSTGMRFSSSH